MQKLKKPVSIILSMLMVLSVFVAVPITASAAVGEVVPESEFLTFTAVENNSSVTLNVQSGSNLQYNKNNSDWASYTAGTQIALASAGDSVRFRGKDTTFNDSNFVSIGGKVACSGNVMSLRLDDNGMVQGLSEQCFFCMFMGCTGLTAAPELPETMLAEGCYSYMFYGCTSLTTAPALPATNLAEACYYGMFYDCENLTTAPKLPATTLANECYNSMFEDCERLTTAPELPATTLAQYCYYHMFAGCSSIKLSETKTAEYSIPYSVPSGGNGTTASAALTGMFANTGGTFKGTPEINTTYYMYVPAPALAPVPYMAWDDTAKQLVEKTGDDACADYTVVADDTTAFEDGKWYVVSEDVTVADRITVSGTANLILCDGKTLTASNGITVETNNTLNIYAQSTGESMGKLTAKTTSNTVQNAVIGGVGSTDCGTVNIHCGDISTSGYAAYSAYPGAGIGGGGGNTGGAGGTVTIYGGKVTASGGYAFQENLNGSGIGGGAGGQSGGNGGTVTIYGGTVTASGRYGTGIGGGNANDNGGDGGTVIIYDGTVEASGSSGIGGGYGYSNGGNGGNVEIYGGKVTTGSIRVAGIGGGTQNADHGTLTVGRAQLVYGGNSENPTTIIKKVNNDYARYRYMTVDTRELADDHEHTFVYTASGNTITAACSVENCEFSGLTPITLTLEAPSPVYDGNPKEAVLSGYPDDAPQGLAAAPTGIVYYTATAPGSTETTGSALSGAPTDVGNYVAQVTWAGETLSVPFSIEYSLTINDGTDTDSNLPVYGSNTDHYQKSQFVIPASDLTNLQGNTLTGLEFYLSSKANKVWDSTFEVYLGPCDFDLFSSSSFADISEHTKVYTGTLDATGDTMNVVFDTGYTYTGGNLLVTFLVAERGTNYASASFYGVYDWNLPNYPSIYATSWSDTPTFNYPSGSYFVPKVTIKYSVPEPEPTYTVTWKNGDDVLETDTDVAVGATPSYDGAEPTKEADNDYTYTFSGWTSSGGTFYAKGTALPAVSGNETYTAQFTAKPKTLIAGHSLSLDGNIGINFYLDPSVAGLTAQQVNGDNLSYTFAWADVETTKAKVNVAEQANQKNFRVSEDGKYIIITCHVCAAEMTCDVIASFTLGDKTESETYSVRKYCDDSVLSENAQYKDDTKLVELVKAMLNYGAMAQTKFGINTGTPGTSDTPGTPGKLANEGVTYNPGDVTGTKIDKAIAEANGNKTADDMNAVAAALGAKWFSTSLIYLDDSTLRHYFVKDTDAFNSSAYTGNKSNYYYYVEVSGIAAAELDNLQSFTAGTESFKYSALDFVKGMITSSADEDSKNLAKSLYWYNQAANAYFPAPAPAENIVDLSTLQGNYEAQNGDVLTGILSGDKQITIADGATVTLRDVDITCLSNDRSTANFAGITLLGDATILLEGENTVKGGYEDHPGVFVPENKTLTINGEGSLTATTGGAEHQYGCGIGAGYNGKPAGNIVINGGTITAIGGNTSAGIGGSNKSNCGDITITGGTVYAESLGRAPGIGAGHGFYGSRCGNITISGGSVTAIGESYGSGIGTGLKGVCGAILITAGVTQVTATKGSDAPNSIGAGENGTCGTVTIEDGANVTQN